MCYNYNNERGRTSEIKKTLNRGKFGDRHGTGWIQTNFIQAVCNINITYCKPLVKSKILKGGYFYD